MWIITTFGFFSIVEKPRDRERGTLTVRSRSRQDLEDLKRTYLPELGDVVESTSADYRFRAQAARRAVVDAIARAVADIDYDNFKAAVGRAQGQARERVYHRVWDELLSLQGHQL